MFSTPPRGREGCRLCTPFFSPFFSFFSFNTLRCVSFLPGEKKAVASRGHAKLSSPLYIFTSRSRRPSSSPPQIKDRIEFSFTAAKANAENCDEFPLTPPSPLPPPPQGVEGSNLTQDRRYPHIEIRRRSCFLPSLEQDRLPGDVKSLFGTPRWNRSLFRNLTQETSSKEMSLPPTCFLSLPFFFFLPPSEQRRLSPFPRPRQRGRFLFCEGRREGQIKSFPALPLL